MYRRNGTSLEDRTDWTDADVKGWKARGKVKRGRIKKVSIPIWLDGKVVASVKELPLGKVFTKTLSRERFIRVPLGIATSQAAIQQAQDAGAVAVSITERETGNFYYLPMDEFDYFKRPMNRGEGEQWLVTLGKFRFNTTEKVQEETPQAEIGQTLPPVEQQLVMFG